MCGTSSSTRFRCPVTAITSDDGSELGESETTASRQVDSSPIGIGCHFCIPILLLLCRKVAQIVVELAKADCKPQGGEATIISVRDTKFSPSAQKIRFLGC